MEWQHADKLYWFPLQPHISLKFYYSLSSLTMPLMGLDPSLISLTTYQEATPIYSRVITS